eukprot:COSAG02_NODE_20146_length_846_cov_1.552878_1_plen_50_part_10
MTRQSDPSDGLKSNTRIHFSIHLPHKSVNGLIWSLLISQCDSEPVPYHSG